MFEYDYNGGCGWLTLQNFDNEALTNFSGRSTREKRNAQTLIKDMEEGYANAVTQTHVLRAKALDRFSIIKLITRQLKIVMTMPLKGKPVLSPDGRLYCNTCYLAIDHIMGLQKISAAQGWGRNEHSK